MNTTQSAPLMIVQFYKGLLKVYANQTNVLEGSAEVVEYKNKNQLAWLEIAESCICTMRSPGLQDTYRKHSGLFIHNEDKVEVPKDSSQIMAEIFM
jgi:hypothetical protein